MRLQNGALRVGLILLRALAVLIGNSDPLEIARIGNRARKKRRIIRKLWHSYHREFSPDEIPLEWIVIDEDERIQTNVKFVCDPSYVFGLVIPVRDETSYIGAFQDHLRMLLERGERVGFIVLRAYRQDNAAVCLLKSIILQLEKGLSRRVALAEDDAFEPIVTDDAAP